MAVDVEPWDRDEYEAQVERLGYSPTWPPHHSHNPTNVAGHIRPGAGIVRPCSTEAR
jgi:hypothetical protein